MKVNMLNMLADIDNVISQSETDGTTIGSIELSHQEWAQFVNQTDQPPHVRVEGATIYRDVLVKLR